MTPRFYTSFLLLFTVVGFAEGQSSRKKESFVENAVTVAIPGVNKMSRGNTIFEFCNCSAEKRTITFDSPVKAFKNWVYGQGDLGTARVVQFEKSYPLDSAFIRRGILGVKKALPKNFWNFSYWGKRFNNEPNEKEIWFMHVYSQINSGNLTIFGAYKITFNGNDASIDLQRADPKIIDVQFFTTKSELIAIAEKLKLASQPD